MKTLCCIPEINVVLFQLYLPKKKKKIKKAVGRIWGESLYPNYFLLIS